MKSLSHVQLLYFSELANFFNELFSFIQMLLVVLNIFYVKDIICLVKLVNAIWLNIFSDYKSKI